MWATDRSAELPPPPPLPGLPCLLSEVLQRPSTGLVLPRTGEPLLTSKGISVDYWLQAVPSPGNRWLEVPGIEGSEAACSSTRLVGVLLEDGRQGPHRLRWAPFQGLYRETHTLVGQGAAVAKETERPGPGNLPPPVVPNCHTSSTPGHALP